MAVTNPNVPFSGVDSVTTQSGGEGGGDYDNARATPEAFGAGVGQAVEKAGEAGTAAVQHFQELAVHTATNDAYVNGYAPKVNAIVSQYKQLSGTDALQQLPAYQKQIKDLNNQYLEMGSPMQRELMGGLVARHTISTMDNMSNHADAAFAQHETVVTAQSIKNASDEAMNNINDPAMVDTQVNRAIGLAKLEGLRKIGSNDGDQSVVDQLSKEAGSNVAASVIKAAMDTRDYQSANNYFNKYSSILSGSQKLELTKQLTDLNATNNADHIIDNLAVGKPAIPAGTPQAEANNTKADVVALAQKEKFDPNVLTALRSSESNNGKAINADTPRKDDFQTAKEYRDKGFEDDSLASSAHNAVKIWNENTPALQSVLGRPLAPKEGYVAYNQGGAGAVELMTAKPSETAVQALSKIMPADVALAHVTKNGGTPTMSAQAFTNHLQDWFQTHYYAQKMTEHAGEDLPQAIRDHGDTTLPAVQQTTNPHDYFEQVASNLPNMRAYAETIPDDKTRDAFNKKIDAKYNQAKVDDGAWKVGQASMAQQYGQDPRYTSMDEIPQTVKADLSKAGQLNALEKMLTDKNNPKKDPTYGEGFLPTLNRISADDPTDRIADIAGLQQEYGVRQDLHSSGFKQLATLIRNVNTPEGKADAANKAQFLSELQRQMVAGPSDTVGKANFEKALPLFFNNSTQNPWEMSMDPDNKNSFVTRNNIQIPTSAQMTSKKIQESVATISALFGASASDNRAAAVAARTAVAPLAPLSKEAQERLASRDTSGPQVPRPE